LLRRSRATFRSRWLAVGLVIGLVVTGCSATAPLSSGSPAADAAAQQARTFVTYATTNAWGNYGEQFTTFCQRNCQFDCNRADRSQAEDIVSAEEVQKFDAEKNNPVAILADIGIPFIPQAQSANVLADYEPPNASLLPANLHGPGWVATFVGVPAILVNLDFMQAHNLPVPHSWQDLLNPAYAKLVGLSKVGISGSGTYSFVAMNLAAGGTLDDWAPGIAYARKLVPNLTANASIDSFEKGEVPIAVRYDFNHGSWMQTLHDAGVNAQIFIPTDGSVYGESALMMNRYDSAHADFGKMFLNWVLTDDAQLIFAKFGARPIRSVVGDSPLVVPDSARVNWLPDSDYAAVKTVDFHKIDPAKIADIWENQVLAGS
jgi:putative spermidine/putrescine transport system substrate-binding protein